ncbi:MAG: cysteine--tRNA ligase [Phycisphaerales bacterium]
MPLHLSNTLTKRDEPFVPLEAGVVTFYTCGPTVYDFAHIGNFRSFLAADALRRWLEHPLCARTNPDGSPEGHAPGEGGYRVTHVMNITDVGHMVDDGALDGGGDDKMEAARKRLLEAKKSGTLPASVAEAIDPRDPGAIADFYAGAFIEDAKVLGIRCAHEAEDDPSLMPRATGHIRAMLELITTLLDKGIAYVAMDGVCYFDTQKFPDYGALSGNTLDAIRSGAGGRVSSSTQSIKKHPADFMLWKPDRTHLMRWDPQQVLDGLPAAIAQRHALNEGYPGWHIECSAMAQERLGERIDLHSGGEDNIFPHHECEIAQSRCAHGTDRFATYWFHPRFLQVDGEKMSKSKGTFFTARDLFAKGFTPGAVRLELIKTHYRANANFTEQSLKDSGRMVERWRRFVEKGEASEEAGAPDEGVHAAFAQAMDNDLGVGAAIGVVNSWMNQIASPTRADAQTMRLFDRAFGVLELPAHAPAGLLSVVDTVTDAGGLSDEEIDAKVRARTDAKKNKDYAGADAIRDELTSMGIELTDGPDGTTWTRTASL